MKQRASEGGSRISKKDIGKQMSDGIIDVKTHIKMKEEVGHLQFLDFELPLVPLMTND